VTEKNPERREIWLPIVLAAEARRAARIATAKTAKTGAVQMETAPEREPFKKILVV